jgi:Ca-activated chloride channel family protein
MNEGGKIDQARVGLRSFLRQLSPHDRVGLMEFATDVKPLVPIDAVAENGPLLRRMASELVAEGSTSLYDAADTAWSTVFALHDDSRINAVVLLSDGADTASRKDLRALLAELRSGTGDEGRSIRIFTIAYGKDASKGVLEQIADASGGEAYSGDPETIGKVYLQISSFF